MGLTKETLEAACEVVYRHMPPTPQYQWSLLRDAIGANVWLKHEDATPAGAFKIRGGFVLMEKLQRERPHINGVVSATRGNHGQSLALAGRTYGVPVTIVVPKGNSVEKNAAMRGFGAELIEHGNDFQEAREHSAEVATERGLEFVSSFHSDLVAGVATYALELFTAAPDLDRVYVPVGMGSGICAVIGVRDLLGLDTEVVGVVSTEAPAYALSFRQKAVVGTKSAHTFVDGVATRQPDPDAVAIIGSGATDVVEMSDTEVADAMRLLYRCTHHLAEPAGAIAFAALCSHRERLAGMNVAAILTGANMDTATASTVLNGGTPLP